MMEASDNESLPGGGSETNHDEGDAGLAIEDISSSGLGRLREMEEKEGVLIYSTDNPQRGGGEEARAGETATERRERSQR